MKSFMVGNNIFTQNGKNLVITQKTDGVSRVQAIYDVSFVKKFLDALIKFTVKRDAGSGPNIHLETPGTGRIVSSSPDAIFWNGTELTEHVDEMVARLKELVKTKSSEKFSFTIGGVSFTRSGNKLIMTGGAHRDLPITVKEIKAIIELVEKDESGYIDIAGRCSCLTTKGQESIAINGVGIVRKEFVKNLKKFLDIVTKPATIKSSTKKEPTMSKPIFTIPVPALVHGDESIRKERTRIMKIAALAGALVSVTVGHLNDGMGAFYRDGKFLFARQLVGPRDRKNATELLDSYPYESGSGTLFYTDKDVSEVIPECKRHNTLPEIGTHVLGGTDYSMNADGTLKAGCQTVKRDDVRKAVTVVKKWLKSADTKQMEVPAGKVWSVALPTGPSDAVKSRIGKIAALAGAKVSITLRDINDGRGVFRDTTGDFMFCEDKWKPRNPTRDYLHGADKQIFVNKDVSDVLADVAPVMETTVKVDITINGYYSVKSNLDGLAINSRTHNKDQIKDLIAWLDKYLKATK